MRTLRSSEAIYMLTMTKLENGSTGSGPGLLPMLPFNGPLAFTLSLTVGKDTNHCSHFTEKQMQAPRRQPGHVIKINLRQL